MSIKNTWSASTAIARGSLSLPGSVTSVRPPVHLPELASQVALEPLDPTKIEREMVERALTVGFIAEARNIVLVAPQGLAKTMIAQNLAHQAILKGYSVLFITAAQLLLDLGSQESSRTLDRRLKHYAKISLLVLDEVGYLAFDNRNADLLFQVVSRRYEKKSLVLTTNLAFVDWPTIFPSATCATALIDRVIERDREVRGGSDHED